MDTKDFDIVCVNLDKRTDRWLESLYEFQKIGIRPIRFSAIVDSNPIVGCAMSHFIALQNAREQKKHLMIFEDDVMFINNYSDFGEYLDALDSLDWDMLYFGGNICRPIYPISDKLGKLTHAQSTHAYCVNLKFIDNIL